MLTREYLQVLGNFGLPQCRWVCPAVRQYFFFDLKQLNVTMHDTFCISALTLTLYLLGAYNASIIPLFSW
jgi:hypothetical protein